MKKIVACALALVLLLGLCACSTEEEKIYTYASYAINDLSKTEEKFGIDGDIKVEILPEPTNFPADAEEPTLEGVVARVYVPWYPQGEKDYIYERYYYIRQDGAVKFYTYTPTEFIPGVASVMVEQLYGSNYDFSNSMTQILIQKLTWEQEEFIPQHTLDWKTIDLEKLSKYM